MPTLNQTLIATKADQSSNSKDVQFPDSKFFGYPDRVIQFGSGALLRGLVDHFVDQANHQGIFRGRVVVVNNTRSGRSKKFAKQDGLFTICEEGFANGEAQRKFYINSSVSQAIPSADNWSKILSCAHNEAITIVFSNTTELGITLQEDDDLSANPPQSFPGKLTAFLYERYKAFAGLPRSGMVIIPTELVLNNGDKLRSIVLRLIEINQLEDEFQQWIRQHNIFCNTLVDRIVPGEPREETQAELEQILGYQDELLTVTEVYCLLAIEGKKDRLIRKAPFLNADHRIVVTEDITPYRERKLRILNGGHTISVAAGFLCGLHTVYNCMQDDVMSKFIAQTIYEEIIPTLEIDHNMAREFAQDVLDRFRNPYLNHQLISITLQYTAKMNMRNGLTFTRYYAKNGEAPRRMCAGLAAYLLFTKPILHKDNVYFGEFLGENYPIKDQQAAFFYDAWYKLDSRKDEDIGNFVRKALTHQSFWDQDMTPFIDQTSNYLIKFCRSDVRNVLASVVD